MFRLDNTYLDKDMEQSHDWFEAQCVCHKGGGGSSGGGSTSGKTDYPSYMKRFHWHIMRGWNQDKDDAPTHGVHKSVLEIQGLSPYAAAYPWDPEPDLDVTESELDILEALVVLMDEEADWTAFYDNAASSIRSGLGNSYTPGLRTSTAQTQWTDANTTARAEQVTTGVTARSEFALDVAAVAAQADTVGYPEEIIANRVEDFDNNQRVLLARAKARMAAGYAAVGATLSSAFVNTDRGLERDHQLRVAEFESQMHMEKIKQRDAFVTSKSPDVGQTAQQIARTAQVVVQSTNELTKLGETLTFEYAKTQEELITRSVNDMINMFLGKISATFNNTQLRGEHNRLKSVLMKEYFDRDLDINVKDALWDISLWEKCGNIMASIAGAATVSKSETEHASPSSSAGGPTAAIGGALSGAAAGAMVAGPAGAVVGGALGLAASM